MDKKPTRTASEKILLIFGTAFAGVGLILATLGLLVGLHPWSPDFDRVITDATIVDFDAYRGSNGDLDSGTVVEYWIDGVRHETILHSSVSGDRVGDTLEISYDPSDPTDVRVPRNDMIVLAILGGMGALFFVIGAPLATVSIIKTRRSARLLNEGRRLSAEILGVEQNLYVAVNNVHPWRIRCQVYLPGSEDPIVCLSPDWTIDPTPLITSQGITTLPVYIDRDDPRADKPYVDDAALRSAMDIRSLRGNSTFTPIAYPKP